MRAVFLLIALSGCASNECTPMPGNKVIMEMGDPISDEELAKLYLPKPEQKNICR